MQRSDIMILHENELSWGIKLPKINLHLTGRGGALSKGNFFQGIAKSASGFQKTVAKQTQQVGTATRELAQKIGTDITHISPPALLIRAMSGDLKSIRDITSATTGAKVSTSMNVLQNKGIFGIKINPDLNASPQWRQYGAPVAGAIAGIGITALSLGTLAPLGLAVGTAVASGVASSGAKTYEKNEAGRNAPAIAQAQAMAQSEQAQEFADQVVSDINTKETSPARANEMGAMSVSPTGLPSHGKTDEFKAELKSEENKAVEFLEKHKTASIITGVIIAGGLVYLMTKKKGRR